ncbi:MAG: MotA/TolQ/ExbB proton channel family protein [Kiritimatiellae bacterium]|nr:MotA/TolQ/ExbB proton channel family protein [Kiritimatiellia bacterium]
MNNRCRILVGTCLLWAVFLFMRCPAEELPEALQRVDGDIRTAQEALNGQREEQALVRRALNEEMEKLERRVEGLSAEVKTLRLAESHDQESLDRMTERARRSREEIAGLFDLAREFRKASDTRLSAAEASLYAEDYEELDAALKRADDPSALADALHGALRLAEMMVVNRKSGLRFTGRCADESGAVLEGNMVLGVGGVYFANDQAVGLCVDRRGRRLPGLLTAGLTASDRAGIRALVEGHAAVVPVDVTSGRALIWAEQGRTLWQHVRAGGVVMIPIVITGLVALYLSVMKAVQLVRIGRDTAVLRTEEAIEALRSGDSSVQKSYFDGIPERMSYLITPLLEYRRESHEKIEEIMHDRILATMPALEKYLGTLAVLGGVAPLLGLLGTVTGIIHVFKMVTVFGSGDATILSGGISEALITTEFGLIIAIPVLLIHAWLARRVRVILGEWERLGVALIQGMEDD